MFYQLGLFCGEIFHPGDYERELTSPNYPGNYPPNINRTWNIVGNTSSRIQLRFVDFHLGRWRNDCKNDFLDVYADNHHVERLCGGDGMNKKYTATRTITIVFKSNNVHNSRGFKAVYQNGKDVLSSTITFCTKAKDYSPHL